MMKRVLVNVAFKDVYTGAVYEAGKTYPMTEARIAEVQKVNPNFVTVTGTDEEYEDELAKTKAELEALKAEQAKTKEKADKKNK